MRARFNAGLNIFDLLIQLVVLFKKAQEVTVSCLEFRNKITVFWKHGNVPSQLDGFNRNIVRSNCQMHQIVEKIAVKTHETARVEFNQGIAYKVRVLSYVSAMFHDQGLMRADF